MPPSTQENDQAAPGVRGPSQARQPSHRRLPPEPADAAVEQHTGLSLADAREWIRQNQSLAVGAAFTLGLVLGIAARR